MPRKVKLFAAGVLLAVIGIACVAIFTQSAMALGGYSDYDPYDGDGWSMSADGVMTIESNQGWANCIRDGYKPEVMELVIGKEVTYFRMYSLPEDLPSPDFFDSFEVAGYDKNGEAYYNYSTEIILRLYKKLDESFLPRLMQNGELEYFMRTVPPELARQHAERDKEAMSRMFAAFPNMEQARVATFSAAFRGAFLTLLLKDEIGAESYDDALRILIRGIALQMMEAR